ncbi:helix-turn-helix transcriptional regulator [Lysobacter sp. P5_B9]
MGFLRLRQIIGDKKAGIPAIIPVARSTFLAGVAEGNYPKPVKLSPGVTAWRVEDIRRLIESAAPAVAGQ